MSTTRQAPADPKVLMKGVKDAQARIVKLQEENDLLKQRLVHLEQGGPDALPSKAKPTPPPSRIPQPNPNAPPASVYAATDCDDQSFLVMDFKGKGMPPGAPPSMAPSALAPSTWVQQPASPSATENSVRAFHNPAFDQHFSQQEAAEWKQMYIDTLKHLRSTKEAIEKERQAAAQWESELRHVQVSGSEDATPRSSIATATAAQHSPGSSSDADGRVPEAFLQKYQQLGLGPGAQQQQLPPKAPQPNVYVMDGLDGVSNGGAKGPIVFDVRTGVTYTESPSFRSRSSMRSSYNVDGGSSFTSMDSSRHDGLGKPKRKVAHSVSKSMQAAKGKGTAPWMRNLFSCVNISDDATKE